MLCLISQASHGNTIYSPSTAADIWLCNTPPPLYVHKFSLGINKDTTVKLVILYDRTQTCIFTSVFFSITECCASPFTARCRPFNWILARQLLIMHVDTTHKVGDEGKRAVLTNPMQMINLLLKFCRVLSSQLALCTWVYPVPRVAWHQTAPLGGFKTWSQRWQRGGTSACLSLGGRCSRVCVQGCFFVLFFFLPTPESVFRFGTWGCCVDFRIITLTPSLHLVLL